MISLSTAIGNSSHPCVPSFLHLRFYLPSYTCTCATLQPYSYHLTLVFTHTTLHLCSPIPPYTCVHPYNLTLVFTHTTLHLCSPIPPYTCVHPYNLTLVFTHTTLHLCSPIQPYTCVHPYNLTLVFTHTTLHLCSPIQPYTCVHPYNLTLVFILCSPIPPYTCVHPYNLTLVFTHTTLYLCSPIQPYTCVHSPVFMTTPSPLLFSSPSLVFEEPEEPSNRSFFSEIIASLSDIKFSRSGRYILSRDYLTVRVSGHKNNMCIQCKVHSAKFKSTLYCV